MTILPVPATPVPAAPGARLRRMRIAMGTSVLIEAQAPTRAAAETAIAAAFAVLETVARRLNPAEPGSDLHALNSAPAGTWVPLWPGTLALLRHAQRLHRASGGLFDPCVPGRPGRTCDLELAGGARAQARARLALEIDCGGIAKGFAVDLALQALRAHGSRAGLVNAGGDLRTFGRPAAPLLLRGADGGLRPLALRGGAVAVSDRDAQRAPSGHRGYYVRTGRAGSVRYAAVRARTALLADALTKCVLLAPPAQARALLEAFGAERLA